MYTSAKRRGNVYQSIQRKPRHAATQQIINAWLGDSAMSCGFAGTTAAMRFFDRQFPDLFSWLVNEMGELPLPRKARERVIRNPLLLITVPC